MFQEKSILNLLLGYPVFKTGIRLITVIRIFLIFNLMIIMIIFMIRFRRRCSQLRRRLRPFWCVQVVQEAILSYSSLAAFFGSFFSLVVMIHRFLDWFYSSFSSVIYHSKTWQQFLTAENRDIWSTLCWQPASTSRQPVHDLKCRKRVMTLMWHSEPAARGTWSLNPESQKSSLDILNPVVLSLVVEVN